MIEIQSIRIESIKVSKFHNKFSLNEMKREERHGKGRRI